jgi:hypothetical protein
MKDFGLNLSAPHHTLTQICPCVHEGRQERETALQHWGVMFPIQKCATIHHVATQIHPLCYVEPACSMDKNESSQPRQVYHLWQRDEAKVMRKGKAVPAPNLASWQEDGEWRSMR